MVNRLVLVNLMHWLGAVDDVLLVNILLNYRLDVLMHMVMDMLSSNSRLLCLGNLGWCNILSITELGALALKLSANLSVVTMLNLASLDTLDAA